MIVAFAPAPWIVIRVAEAGTLSAAELRVERVRPGRDDDHVVGRVAVGRGGGERAADRATTAVQPVPAVSAVVLTVNVAACAGAATASATSPAKRAARTRISRH